MIKTLWKIASTVATIITIKNQLNALSNAPKELADLSSAIPSDWAEALPKSASPLMSDGVYGVVVLPQTATQGESLKAGV